MDESGNVVMEHWRHQPLEWGGGITVPLLHYSTHKGAEYSGECGFRYILWFNVYLFICLQHVQLGPVGSMSNIMLDHVLIRKWQCILFCIIILHTEVEHCMQLATFLQHAEHGHCLSNCGRHPLSDAGILADLFGKFSFQRIGTFRQAIYDLFAGINELNLMIHLPERGKLGGHASNKVCDLVHPLLPQVREFRGWQTTPPQCGSGYVAFMQARAYVGHYMLLP